MNRGKRRSRAQRIGIKGEAFFLGWATDHGMSANKVGEDYGVDFFCQLLRPVGKHGSEEATGAVIAVQVRATEGTTRPRIKLDRVDAVNLLRQYNTTCLIAVQVKDSTVSFKFLDEDFISALNNFLSSSKATFSIQLKDMQSDPILFNTMLKYYSKPGTVQRLMIYKVESEIAHKIPGSSLSVQQGKAGGFAVIDVPWIGSALNFPAKKAEAFRRMVFEEGKLPANLDGMYVKANLKSVSNLVDGSVLVRGRFERDCEVTLKHKGNSISATFQLRALGDEWAYSHPVGLCFIISDRRKKNGVHVHLLEARLFHSELPLGSSAQVLDFLKFLKPEAQVMIDGKPFISLNSWGENITHVGPAIEALQDICSPLGLNLDHFHLSDLHDEEFGRSLSILDATLLRNIPLRGIVHSFILGPLAEQDPESIATEAVIMALPIAMNLKNKGIILWGYGSGFVFVDDDKQCCGFKFGGGTEWSTEAHAKFKKSKFPELWVTKSWPPVRLGETMSEGLQSFEVTTASNVNIEAIIKQDIATCEG